MLFLVALATATVHAASRTQAAVVILILLMLPPDAEHAQQDFQGTLHVSQVSLQFHSSANIYHFNSMFSIHHMQQPRNMQP